MHTMYRPFGLRMVGGVCAAFAVRFGWDLTATRIITVIFAIFLFPFTEMAYLVAWLVIPEEVPFAVPHPGVNVSPNPVANVPNPNVQPR